MQREYFAIYVSVDEINFQHPPLISVHSPMVLWYGGYQYNHIIHAPFVITIDNTGMP